MSAPRWTRPQQLAAAAYGVWAAFWTVIIGFVLVGQHRALGVVAVLVPTAICLGIGVLAYRGVRWAFWPALVWFTLTGLGAIWVPLRPRAHAGEDLLTLVVHAFVADLPGLFVGGWLIVGLVRRKVPEHLE